MFVLFGLLSSENRYNGEIGDIVIGRVKEVAQKRWRVDTHSRMDSILMLSSVNLPGGELVSSENCQSLSCVKFLVAVVVGLLSYQHF